MPVVTPKYLLESFAYFQDWQVPMIVKAKDFILDSGAFTYMHDRGGQFNAWEYAEQYADFIVRHNIKNYVELDVDTVLGYDEVLKLRAYLEKTTGKPCMPVWHVWRGEAELIKMLDKYDYACLGGFVSNVGGGDLRPKAKYLPHIMALGRKHKCHLHGLGFTKTNWLNKIPFYSVDSSSWLAGGRFGDRQWFDGVQMKSKAPPKNTRVKEHFLHNDKRNLLEWMKFVDYAKEYL